MRLPPLRAIAIALAPGLLLGCRGGPAEPDGPRPEARAPRASPAPGNPRAGAPPRTQDASRESTLGGLTLEDAFELARRSHPDLAAARARIAGAQARAAQAGRLPNPDAALRVESASLEGSTFESAEILAGLSQPLPIGGRLPAADRAARADLLRAELELEAADLDVQSRVRGAFATVLYAQEAAELRGELLEQADRLVEIFEARLARGDVTPEDGLVVELASLEARHELERARSLLAAARGELALALARPGLEIASVAGELEPALSLPAIEEVLAAIGRSPRILSAAAAAEADQARVALASAERVPDLRLELFYRRIEASDQDAFDAGVGLFLPIFQRGGPRVDEARSRLAESRARQRTEELQLESGARVAHGALGHALAELERMDRELLPRVERMLATQERRFAAGDLALPELLLARAHATRTRLQRLEVLRAALAAWAELAPLLAQWP